MKRLFFVTVFALVALLTSAAQDSLTIDPNSCPLTVVPESGKSNFAVCYQSGRTLYSIKSKEFGKNTKVIDVALGAPGTIFAVMYDEEKERRIGIFSALDGKSLHTFKLQKQDIPVRMWLTSDSRYMILTNSVGRVQVYELKSYRVVRTLLAPAVPECMTISPNLAYMAFSANRSVYVYNFEKNILRGSIELGDSVRNIFYSSDSRQMGVLTHGGVLNVYDSHLLRAVNTYAQHGADNKRFAVCYENDRKSVDVRYLPFKLQVKVMDVKMSPANYSFMVMYEKDKTREIGVFSTMDGKCLHTFKFKAENEPTRFHLTSDARYMFVSCKNGELHMYGLKYYNLLKKLSFEDSPECVSVSDNRYYAAIAINGVVYVYNFEKGTLRKTIQIGNQVKDITFTPGGSQMGVLTVDGNLRMFETRRFENVKIVKGMAFATRCSPRPVKTCYSFVTMNERIILVNRNEHNDAVFMGTDSVVTRNVGYAKSFSDYSYLLFSYGKDVIPHPKDTVKRSFHEIVADSVTEKLTAWTQRMSGETLEQYQRRVNEATRKQKIKELELAVSTQLAGNLIDSVEASFGNYNTSDSVLEVKLYSRPSIYIKVGEEELGDFANADDLVFENTLYAVDDKDNFVLMYTEVTNKKTGKKYVYDNKDNQDVNYAMNTESDVPLDVIQQSNIDEIKLETMRNDILTQAMESNLISDHTNINVMTDVEMATDAEGKKILNYTVDFNYEVEQEFSEIDDYKAGQYLSSESEAANAMLQIVKKAYAEQFASYLKPGRKVQINLYGSADATPIKRTLKYAGEYGDFVNELYYDNGELDALTVTQESGIQTNEQLSFLRAAGVKDFVSRNIKQLQRMDVDYTYNVSVSEQSGAEFRRIGIRFTFIDVFE